VNVYLLRWNKSQKPFERLSAARWRSLFDKRGLEKLAVNIMYYFRDADQYRRFLTDSRFAHNLGRRGFGNSDSESVV
jgi:hypothetical protein